MKQALKTFFYSVLAGCCITLGGAVFLRIKDLFPGSNIIGSVLFTVGLFTICTRGYNLFTGKACYLFDNPPSYVLTLVEIWLGNLVGCAFFSALMNLTSMCGENGINAAAAAMVEAKMACTPLNLFVLGFFCNMCIFIAVSGYAKDPSDIGKHLALFFGVVVFILCGTEHSIADMFYWCLSGIIYKEPIASFGCILIVTMGNIVGGVFFPVCEKLIKKL